MKHQQPLIQIFLLFRPPLPQGWAEVKILVIVLGVMGKIQPYSLGTERLTQKNTATLIWRVRQEKLARDKTTHYATAFMPRCYQFPPVCASSELAQSHPARKMRRYGAQYSLVCSRMGRRLSQSSDLHITQDGFCSLSCKIHSLSK